MTRRCVVNPLQELDDKISDARVLRPTPEPLKRGRGAPLELVLERLEAARRVASSPPPLTSLQDAIEQARQMSSGDEELAAEETLGFDPLAKLSVDSTQPKSLAAVPVLAGQTPAGSCGVATAVLEMGASAKPVAPAPGEEKRGEAMPAESTDTLQQDLVISQLLLDALATRSLTGDARSRAADLLAQGIATGNQAYLKSALAILVTGA